MCRTQKTTDSKETGESNETGGGVETGGGTDGGGNWVVAGDDENVVEGVGTGANVKTATDSLWESLLGAVETKFSE